MDFKWTMTEEEWGRLVNDSKSTEHINNNVYGQVFIGNLCIDFLIDEWGEGYEPMVLTFCLWRNTGYARTERDIPYDCLDSYFIVPIECETFERFKKECEHRIKEMLQEDGLQDEANKKTEIWW